MYPDPPHKQNLPMSLPIQRRIYQSSVNKGIMWPTVSPGTETRGKNLRKSKTKKTLHGLRNRLLKKSQYQIVDSRLLMQTPPQQKILTTPLF